MYLKDVSKQKNRDVDLKFNSVTHKIMGGFFNTSNEITHEGGYQRATVCKHTYAYGEAYIYLKKKIRKQRDEFQDPNNYFWGKKEKKKRQQQGFERLHIFLNRTPK